MRRSFVRAVSLLGAAFVLLTAGDPVLLAQATGPAQTYGPFNATVLPDGDGIQKPLEKSDLTLTAVSPWSMYAWVKTARPGNAPALIAGVGEPSEEFPRYLAADGSRVFLWMGNDNELVGAAPLTADKWHLLAVTFDTQQFHLYVDGSQVAEGKLDLGHVSPVLQLAPPLLPTPAWRHFGGKIAGLTLVPEPFSAAKIKELFAQPPDFSIIDFEDGSKPWPVQTKGQAGYRFPQDPATMPKSKAPISRSVPKITVSSLHVQPQPAGPGRWTIAGAWEMAPEPIVSEDGAVVSQPGFNANRWWPATVPGTALTTMIDQGVYPDPDYGLNNLAIPESLNKQDYWYRSEFRIPNQARRRKLTLTFEGINYFASVWLNGRSLGSVKGAFIRGVFDITNLVKAEGTNVLAVRVSPPPHPGIPQEQSLKGGPGENGGIMCLDGPTFVATEGWDWVPAIRDRDTGIWQPVTLTATDAVKIGDAQIVTTLPLPDTSRAEVEIAVPLDNTSASPVSGTLKASFADTSISKPVTLNPGKNSITLTPTEFAQLTIQHPRLWWPNGYGKPELYTLMLSFSDANGQSDSKQVRFGIREITYELSLLDVTGIMRRMEYSPATEKKRGQAVLNLTHNGIREIPAADPFPPNFPPDWKEGWKSWVGSISAGAESSAALRVLTDTRAAPYLVIKVNGVRIACRGGNWGMDDSRKRVSGERLEPYFRLHRDANLNIIRNWVGQNTEEVFYDLADEYGLLVWNDFWESTQNYNIEPEDPQLFLDNARDTILRFRNHPSIAVWCGRNEGVPQPIINEGLAELVRLLDGTRYYSPSSNQIELQNSGPYKYTDPTLYYTTLNHGFSVETGTPSFSTLESFRAWIPKEDEWPISDDWAYHDWHQSGNGDMAPFMAEMEAEFGAPVSLEDFERKAQMLDYVDHRAIFEGMNAHLWAPNSARMLWMTQPAWPSNTWQILTSDYDTQSSFYAVKKACEPVHVQLDLSNYDVQIINTTRDGLIGLRVSAKVFALDNRLLFQKEEKKDAEANSASGVYRLDLAPLLGTDDVAIVNLELRNASGQVISRNLYWLGPNSAAYRRLNRLAVVPVDVAAKSTRDGDNMRIHVVLQNRGTVVALQNKLTLLSANGSSRILPVYYSDNYLSLLPGETRELEIEFPAGKESAALQLAIRGWNTAKQTIELH